MVRPDSCADGTSCTITGITYRPRNQTRSSNPTKSVIDSVYEIEGGLLHEQRDVLGRAQRVLEIASTLSGRSKDLDRLVYGLSIALSGGDLTHILVAMSQIETWNATAQDSQLATAFEKVSCSCSGPDGRSASCNY